MSDTISQTMSDAKAACKKGPVGGLRFTITNTDNPRAAAGIQAEVLAQVSVRNKVSATLTCAYPGCTETHVREISDWHQSAFCASHSKKTGTKMTEAEKAERALARAQVRVAAIAG